MYRLGRNAVVAFLLILYGSVSVGGVSLHAVLETTLAHHDHGPVNDEEPTVSGVSHDCLLCDFFAQAQLTLEAPPTVSRPLPTPHLAIALPSIGLGQRSMSCHSRAPPRRGADA